METHELPSVLFMTPPIALEMWAAKPSGSISGGGAIDLPKIAENMKALAEVPAHDGAEY